jgi:hypothetical protein
MIGVFIRLTQVGALGVVAALAAGCAADPAVEAAPTADAAATTLATPDAGALQEAEYTEQDQRAADEAAVRRTVERYFALALPSTMSRPALEKRQALFATSCDLCVSGSAVAEDFLRQGFQVKGGTHKLRTSQIRVSGRAGSATVQLTRRSYRVLDVQGRLVAAEAAQTSRTRFSLQRQPNGAWLITSARRLPGPQ